MTGPGPLSQTLTQLVTDGLWGNPWHSLSEAMSELSDADLDYRPVAGAEGHWMSDMARPAMYGARAIVRHLVGATLEAGETLPEPPEPPAACWRGLEPFDWEDGAASLREACDVVHREAAHRAAALADEQLLRESGAGGALAGWSNAEVVVQCLVLHPSWHLGQLALIPKWRRMGHGAPPVPAAPRGGEALTPCGDWPFHLAPLSTRRELLLEVLRQAQSACPWHALERTLGGLTDEEATWPHHPDTEDDQAQSVRSLCIHVACCDVMYADMAFGERRNDWRWAGQAVGAGSDRSPAEACLAMCRRGYESLVERAGQASEEQLDTVHAMHHGQPLLGWQVVATMVQHRLWHAGQIALIRDAYAGR